MSKRMTSETIIFDTDWLTEADFDFGGGVLAFAVVIIDYRAYDTLKIIVDVPNIVFDEGGLFQELEVYKLENQELAYRPVVIEANDDVELGIEGDFGNRLHFGLEKSYWEENIKGIGSIYIKGVKR